MAAKLNVQIRTLLTNCEELAKDETNYWRIANYIKSLDTMVDELKHINHSSSADKLAQYVERLEALKLLTKYVEYTPSTLVNNKQPSINKYKLSGLELGEHAVRETQQLRSAKEYLTKRSQLFEEDSLRRRTHTKNPNVSSEHEGVAVKKIRENQEKIAEHMLTLTRNLKEQTVTANRIIKNDTEVVVRSTGIADVNLTALGKESAKLEKHSYNVYKCWMCFMMGFVIITFIVMVLFMKIVKKKKT